VCLSILLVGTSVLLGPEARLLRFSFSSLFPILCDCDNNKCLLKVAGVVADLRAAEQAAGLDTLMEDMDNRQPRYGRRRLVCLDIISTIRKPLPPSSSTSSAGLPWLGLPSGRGGLGQAYTRVSRFSGGLDSVLLWLLH
jgi:hypothetical protein